MKKLQKKLFLLFFVMITMAFTPMAASLSKNHSQNLDNEVPLTTQATIMPVPYLRTGDFYLSLEGSEVFMFSRNLAGNEIQQYTRMLDMTRSGGSRMVRLQLDSFGTGITKDGNVDDLWAWKWEQVLDKAAENQIYVLLTFTAWYDWNDGKPDFGYSQWKVNAFSTSNGGPAATPAELFKSESSTQTMWLSWIKKLVERWQERRNIASWEIFSEVNLASGTSQSSGVALMEKAAALIRAADTNHRPLTASLADVGEWQVFLRSKAIDFINIHPYPGNGKLDRKLLLDIPKYLAKYKKPVMIGESGLSALTPDSNPPTFTTAERADIGIRHAIWAGLVSGAMNGRSLWWGDGVGVYFPALSWNFLNKYADAELAAARFIEKTNLNTFSPINTTFSSGIIGAAIGNERSVIGWFRDAKCEPPDWKLQPVISKQNITVTVPGSAGSWRVDFYNTRTGTDILSSIIAARKGQKITFTLPDFTDDIAFKMISTS